MGQTASTGGDSSPVNFSAIHSGLLRHASTLREVTSLTYDEFIRAIQEVNKISLRFTDEHEKYLIFKVKPGSDTTMLWKGTVRVDCVKVDKSDNIESVRQLNIRQFLQARKVILSQMGVGMFSSCHDVDDADPASCNLTASMILNSVDAMECSSSLDECCICMERKPDIILPCAHNYCLPCIEQWNDAHKTCPVCRETLDSTEDSWVISEKPDSDEMSAEIKKCLDGLSSGKES